MLSPTLRTILGIPAVVGCLLITCSGSSAGAELAQWSTGDGMIADAQAASGASIAGGVSVRSSAGQPALLDLAGGTTGSITMAPASEISFSEGTTDSGQPMLLLTVNRGTVQVDLTSKGKYAAVDVVTGNLQVEVVGTLFLVGNQPHDTGYVALVRGHIRARLAALKKATNEWIAVEAHHGIGSGADGLNVVDALTMRPQLFNPDGHVSSLRDQGTQTASASASAASWHQDSAGAVLLLAALHGSPGLAAKIVAHNVAAAGDAEAALMASGHVDEAKRLISDVAAHQPASLPAFCQAAVTADSANAAQVVSTAATADPSAAAAIITAVLTDLSSGNAGADHASPLDVVVAAVVAAPSEAGAIESAAIAADPADKTAMVGLLNILAPNAQAAVAATTTAPATSGTPAGTGAGTVQLPATPAPATGAGAGSTANASDFNLPASSAGDSCGHRDQRRGGSGIRLQRRRRLLHHHDLRRQQHRRLLRLEHLDRRGPVLERDQCRQRNHRGAHAARRQPDHHPGQRRALIAWRSGPAWPGPPRPG